MRIIKEHSFKHGLNFMAIEAKDEVTLDRLIAKINILGWKQEWTACVEDCDYGWATSYAVRCDVREDFIDSFKSAKAELKAEMQAEKLNAEQASMQIAG